MIEGQSRGVLAQSYIAMEEHEPSNTQQNYNCQYDKDEDSPSIPSECNRLIIRISDEDPYTLDKQIDVEDGIDCYDSKEIFIVLSADAIIEKFAMMVKIGRTAVAAIAMMTVNMHVSIAYHAITQFLNSVAVAQLLVQHQRIHRIIDCEVNVVIADTDHEQKVKTQQYPENSMVDVVHWRDDKD